MIARQLERLGLGLRLQGYLRLALSRGCVAAGHIHLRHRLAGVGLVGLRVVELPFLDGDSVAEKVEMPLCEQAFEFAPVRVFEGHREGGDSTRRVGGG